jgi:hypothetical protein
MAYYKVQIEIWCDWDPESSSLYEIVESTHLDKAICTRQEVVDEVDRPKDIDDEDAMSFFGGELGDAEKSTG